QKLLQGDIAEEAGPLVVERYFAAFTRYLEIERNLAEGRPKLRSGTLPEDLATLRDELVNGFKDGASVRPDFEELSKDPAFFTYVRRMASAMYDGPQLRPQELAANPFLKNEILEHLAAEFSLILCSDMTPSLRKDHAHKRSVFKMNDIYQEAAQEPALEGFEKTAARLVVQNSYPSIPAVVEERATLQREAEELYGNDPILKPIVGTIARFSLLGTYPSIQAGAKVYLDIWNVSKIAIAERPELESVQRTLVGLVHQKLYPDFETALKRYDSVQIALYKHLKKSGDPYFPVDNLTSLILKKSYPSVAAGIARYDEISKEVADEFGEDQTIKGLSGTAASMILEGRYKSALDAAKALRTILKECDRVLVAEADVGDQQADQQKGGETQEDYSAYDSSRGTLAWLVFKRKFPSVLAAKQQLDLLTEEAADDMKRLSISQDQLSFDLKRTSARMVLTSMYPSTSGAIEAYIEAKRTAEEYTAGDTAKARWNNSIAYVLWTKKSQTAQGAYEFVTRHAPRWQQSGSSQ
ncbi:MAG: hypothetical protein KDD70_15890, partial [Bdellovibrionales bacterium]|nr:hypothetical protein [Bdellovibrionales bacterium]